MVSKADFDDKRLYTWHVENDKASVEYECTSFTAAGELVQRIAAIADDQDHHPDLAVRYPGVVTVTTTSHDQGELTQRDLDLALAVDEAGRGLVKLDLGDDDK
ncbi:4a-hydroxytetrahydrobiopterin dehydratase [Nocardioides mangrovicus]|uniref:Putative pterin-4-alpha-carbinolamine dehydratase n=1 Tax=Nocardioides mangrovicus TaxID=2478913 RepID=A0A3L8NZ60_9ACTN|nr:4a-hydroxytetrahydrobiopterin dehydratase [Nocardioides mangrovicus]RLV48496.1 4a-hydroxytetrahydrobiopterin dehydratase [Nocardioides mangrovicus]